MKRRRPMSYEEKRDTMLSVFHEYMEPMNMKELETRGDKAGVVMQSVKDAVQSLVDEKRVDTDKIGSGVFYWSFPSSHFLKAKTSTAELEKLIEREKQTIESLDQKIVDAAASLEDGPEREENLKKLEALKTKKEDLEKEIESLKEFDPVVLKELYRKVKLAKQSADRWTDALLLLKSYLVKTWGKDSKSVDEMLGIDDGFDYIE